MALRLSAVEGRAPGGYLLSRDAVALVTDGGGRGPDLLTRLRSEGLPVRVQDVDGCRPCHGGQESLLDANRRLLEGIAPSCGEASLVGGRIQGPVIVHPSARIERSVVRGPAIIGANTRIADAYVGPYSSIGAGVQIEGAEIEHSIVLDDARIAFVGTRLESSVIGRGARVMRTFELPSAIRLAVGDGADVTLS
jgi:glucose-1-phosphate thymidylyltransferase